MRRRLAILSPFVSLAAFVVAAGCRSTLQVERSPRYDDQSPLRVAILPFEDRSEGGFFSALAAPFKAVADLFVARSGAPPSEPAVALRQAIAAHLRLTNLDLVDLRHVDTTLHHERLLEDGGARRLRDVPARRLGDLLGADALLLGTVTTYGADYFLAESRVTIGADLELVDVYSGETLWKASGQQSMSFGLTKGPTGQVSGVLEPIKGLRDPNLWAVSAELARNVGSSLRGRAEIEEGVDDEPAPYVSVAVSSVEPGATLAAGDVVRVVALGSGGARATFDVGDVRRGLPMVEFGAGTYQGTYTVLEGDHFAGEIVTVVLRNRRGLAATREILHAPLETTVP